MGLVQLIGGFASLNPPYHYSNSKSEARSTKQIQNSNVQMFKTELLKNTCLVFGSFETGAPPKGWGVRRTILKIRICFGFRI